MATNPASFSEAATTLAARIAAGRCRPGDADEFWRLIRLAQVVTKPAV